MSSEINLYLICTKVRSLYEYFSRGRQYFNGITEKSVVSFTHFALDYIKSVLYYDSIFI